MRESFKPVGRTGVIHFDTSQSNVIIVEQGEVFKIYVIDFGWVEFESALAKSEAQMEAAANSLRRYVLRFNEEVVRDGVAILVEKTYRRPPTLQSAPFLSSEEQAQMEKLMREMKQERLRRYLDPRNVHPVDLSKTVFVDVPDD